jgi:hypothetical protein
MAAFIAVKVLPFRVILYKLFKEVHRPRGCTLLWETYLSTSIMFLDIIHCLVLSVNRPVYCSKHNVLETGFCLRLQVKPTQFGLIDRASPYLRIF